MSKYIHYPRRTDAVVAISYGDSQSVSDIYEDLGGPDMSITVKPGSVGDVLHVGGFDVSRGEVVVIRPGSGLVLEVLDSWDFNMKYSKDGL